VSSLINADRIKLHKLQKLVHRDWHRFRVIVAGRRWGKCLASGTMISMADGSEKPVEMVEAGDLVLTINQDTYGLEPKSVDRRLDNGLKETVIVRTAARNLQVTPNHPLLVNNTWIDAGDLRVGDLVAVPRTLAFGTETMPDHELVLLATWLAEGADYRIINQTPKIVEQILNAARIIGLEGRAKDGLNWYFGNGDRSGGPLAGTRNPLRRLLEKHELWGLNSKTKIIPEAIFSLDEVSLARFLNLFIACDSSISHRSKNTWSLEIVLANEVMVRQLAKLLHKFGIRAAVRHKVHKAVSSRTGLPFESWALVVSDPTMLAEFCIRIGALSKESAVEAALLAGAQSRGNCNSYLPITYDNFVQHLVDESVDKGKYGGHNALVARDMPEELRAGLNSWRKQSQERMSRSRFAALRKYTDGFFDPLADGDLAWEEITAVGAGPSVQTWDLALPENHNFVAEGIITHNTQISRVSLITAACNKSNQIVWYVAPTYQMARDIMWEELKSSLPKAWARKINETRMVIYLINGSRIHMKGADKPDTLRGVGLHFLVIDEAQDIAADAWWMVLSPTLASTGGRALIIGTPKSYNWLYDVFVLGQRGEMVKDERSKLVSNEWKSWQFKTITSPFIAPKEIVMRKRDMDPKSFSQEFEASFQSMSGRVYYPFDRNHHVKDCKFNPKLPIHIGMDFNIDPMSAIIIQEQPNGEIWVIDECVLFGSNVEETAEELDRRYFKQKNQVAIYPDPAGNNRNHDRGESSLDILREMGFKTIRFKRKHPAVDDRVNSVNRLLRTADGETRLFVDPNCRKFIDSLEQTIYKEGRREIDKSPGTEHATDAFGYYSDFRHPMRKMHIGGYSF
jgi:intein/homing endonuclease